MKLGLYSVISFILISIIGAFVYTLELGAYRLEMFNISLPITAWIILPLFVLFVFTLLHMIFYSTKTHFKFKKWQKDMDKLEDALYWSVVNEPKGLKYTNIDIKDKAVLLSKSSLVISDNMEGLSPKLAKAVNIIQKIKNGEYVDLKESKMDKVFKDGNPLLIQNRLNCLESDAKFVEEVMRSSSQYSIEVRNEALTIFARKENFDKARKYIKVFNVENFLVMLNRVSQEDDIGLTKEILMDFVSGLKLSCKDFVKIAEVTKKYFKPEENLALFSQYQIENDKAQNAYLYLLFEYELLDQISAYLDEQEPNEFMKFRALYYLKSEHSKYKLDDIIDIHSVCSENTFI